MTPALHVIVCGAGLTGLTTAWHLRRAGVDVTLLETSDVVGGVMRTTQRDGYLVEHGPNSCMLTPELSRMVDALGLARQVQQAAPAAQRRYIVRNGRPHAVPMSPVAMLASPLFSMSAKLRILREPFIAKRGGGRDESVAAFVRRRLGDEPLTWAVDPFVSGVYAGDPEQLSITHAFPRLAALEREHGSLLRGVLAGARRKRVPADGTRPPARSPMISFAGGMGTLPHALANEVGTANIVRRARITGIAHLDGSCRVTIEREGGTVTIDADAVVSTLPTHALQSVTLPEGAHPALAQLAALQYPPVASLALGYRREDVSHPLDGFGCLIPSVERRKTLGVLFSSTLFAGRAPDGHVLLTCFLGGVRQPEVGLLGTVELTEIVQAELATILGVRGAPTFVQHTTWPHAIPQYNLGHEEHSRSAEAIESVVPGLIVDGQFRRGVSVGDCVAAGEQIALRAATAAQAVRAGRDHGAATVG